MCTDQSADQTGPDRAATSESSEPYSYAAAGFQLPGSWLYSGYFDPRFTIVFAALDVIIQQLDWVAQTLGGMPALEEKINQVGEKIMAASQADINALTALIRDNDSRLNAAVGRIVAWIEEHANDDAVDVTELQAAVAELQGGVDEAAALVPEPDPEV